MSQPVNPNLLQRLAELEQRIANLEAELRDRQMKRLNEERAK